MTTNIDSLLGIKPEQAKSPYGKDSNLYRWTKGLNEHRTLTCFTVETVEEDILKLPDKILKLFEYRSVGDIDLYTLRDTIYSILLDFKTVNSKRLLDVRKKNTDLAGKFKVAMSLLADLDPEYAPKYGHLFPNTRAYVNDIKQIQEAIKEEKQEEVEPDDN